MFSESFYLLEAFTFDSLVDFLKKSNYSLNNLCIPFMYVFYTLRIDLPTGPDMQQ